jgi:hypothetical protein
MKEKWLKVKSLIDEGKLAEAKSLVDEIVASVPETSAEQDDEKTTIGGGAIDFPIKK